MRSLASRCTRHSVIKATKRAPFFYSWLTSQPAWPVEPCLRIVITAEKCGEAWEEQVGCLVRLCVIR